MILIDMFSSQYIRYMANINWHCIGATVKIFLILFSLSSYYSFLINCTDILSIFLFHNKNTNFLHNMYFCLHKNEEGFKNPLNCFHDIYLFNFGKSSYFKMSIFYFFSPKCHFIIYS